MINSPQKRAVVTCWFLAACFTGFSCRLVHLQVTRHEDYAERAADNHGAKQITPARRGFVRDVHGEMLAQNEPIKTVIADGTKIKTPEVRAVIASILARKLEMPEPEVFDLLGKKRSLPHQFKDPASPYIIVKKEVPESVAQEIATELAAEKVGGVHFEQDTTRVYPNGQMLCHVLGTVNSESVGMEGIERNLDHFLRGQSGFRYIERDCNGKELVQYRGQEKSPQDGHDVRLTIDMGLQQIVESELDNAMKQFKPKMASVILMRPQTGEVLAMANRPAFNLNPRRGVPDEHRKNRAVTDLVEPGSTFKIVTVAAALQQKLVSPDTYIFCENGRFAYGGRALRDHHPYSDLTVEEILVKSSNVGVAKLGIQLGERKLHEYVRRFGFGDATGINLPGEIRGQLRPPHMWEKVSITRIPMGHEVAVTPLQVVSAMSVIANGGRLLMPQIVREVTNNQGEVVQKFEPMEVRRVVSEETAKTVRDALVKVVSKKGTASLAHVSGFTVAGKTGTAQKVAPGGGYEQGKWVVSFAGFMPAENPEFVALVLLDDAVTKAGQNYGGLVAAPIFSRIAERAARYLNPVPTPEPPPGDLIITQRKSIRD